MAIDDHCGYCPFCEQVSLARRYACVWCGERVKSLPLDPEPTEEPYSLLSYAEAVHLHGLHRHERLTPWELAGAIRTTRDFSSQEAAHEALQWWWSVLDLPVSASPARWTPEMVEEVLMMFHQRGWRPSKIAERRWKRWNYSSRNHCATYVRRLLIDCGVEITSAGRVEIGLMPEALALAMYPYHHTFRRVFLAERYFRQLGYRTATTCDVAIATHWKRAGLTAKKGRTSRELAERAAAAEREGALAPLDRLVAEVVEGKAPVPQLQLPQPDPDRDAVRGADASRGLSQVAA